MVDRCAPITRMIGLTTARIRVGRSGEFDLGRVSRGYFALPAGEVNVVSAVMVREEVGCLIRERFRAVQRTSLRRHGP